MNRSLLVSGIAIVLVFFPVQSSISQVRYLAGASVPLAEFAATDSATGGFAKPGISIGVDYTEQFYFGSEIGFSAILEYHSVDDAAIIQSHSNIESGSYLTTGPWLLFWPMASLGFTQAICSHFDVYFRGHGGILYGVSPEMTVDEGGTLFTQSPAIKITFGWGIGAGVDLFKRIDVGVRYLTANPDYDINVQGGGTSTQARSRYVTKTLQVLIGYIP